MGWEVQWHSRNRNALVGIVVMENMTVGPSPGWLRARLITPTPAQQDADQWDLGIRTMLRAGGFKPTGRNRPAHEFLARAEGGIAGISNVVDANNAVSVARRIPASVIDADVTGGTLALREGRPGERYVFNRSGQELDLGGLLVVCGASDEPLASPVKDSLKAHVTERTRGIVFCAYGSLDLMDVGFMDVIGNDFIRLASEAAGGRVAAGWILSAQGIEARFPGLPGLDSRPAPP